MNKLKGWTESIAIEDTCKLIHETIGDIRIIFPVEVVPKLKFS